MSIMGIVLATASVGVVGLLIGVFLGIAGEKFKVDVDPKEEAVLAVLPGNNCGGCGFAGCSGLAAAIAKGEAAVDVCPVGGAAVGSQIASIMGKEAVAGKQMVAYVKCAGTCEKAKLDYAYYGVQDCKMLAFVPNGGAKSCSYGCLGFGTCVKACPFDAIHIQDGIAVVDKEACKACGKCIAECPKHIIELVPMDAKHIVACSSKEKGAVANKECTAACIGCGLCVKECPAGAITVTDFLAHIDQDKCTGCGACVVKCPKKAII